MSPSRTVAVTVRLPLSLHRRLSAIAAAEGVQLGEWMLRRLTEIDDARARDPADPVRLRDVEQRARQVG